MHPVQSGQPGLVQPGMSPHGRVIAINQAGSLSSNGRLKDVDTACAHIHIRLLVVPYANPEVPCAEKPFDYRLQQSFAQTTIPAQAHLDHVAVLVPDRNHSAAVCIRKQDCNCCQLHGQDDAIPINIHRPAQHGMETQGCGCGYAQNCTVTGTC